MTKTELKKLKELDAFLRERNMELCGENIIVGFNANKYDEKDNFVRLNLRIGFLRGSLSDIAELKVALDEILSVAVDVSEMFVANVCAEEMESVAVAVSETDAG